jgi:hypothetical protein
MTGVIPQGKILWQREVKDWVASNHEKQIMGYPL